MRGASACSLIDSVAFISADWAQSRFGPEDEPLPGGAGWYRCALPSQHLAAHGTKVAHVPYLAAHRQTGEIYPVGWDGECDTSGYEIIVLQRWMQDEAPAVVRRARAFGQVVISDMDDWFFGLDPANAAFASTHPKTNANHNLNHFRSVLAASDAITCSTPFLVDRLAHLAPTLLVRNAIDLDRWPIHTGSPGLVTVGWVGSTGWRSGDLETLRGVLGPYLKRHGYKFVHHGHREDLPLAYELAGIQSDLVGPSREMVPISEYPRLFAGIDIGIVPLRDTPFNTCKSAIKAMEYSASGIAYVAQASDENMWFDATACARRPKDWIRRLEQLTDSGYRHQESKRLRARVEELSMGRRWVDWQKAIEAVSG